MRDRSNEQGVALLGALMIMLILALLGATLLNLAGQESVSAAAGRDAAVAQQLADAAADAVVGWFHGNQPASPAVATVMAKRNRNAGGAASFFDPAGRSQFVGTADHPDLAFDESQFTGLASGFFASLDDLGSVKELKVYGPSRPGLLATVDATVTVKGSRSLQSIRLQLGALDVPPLRAAIQVGRDLGFQQAGEESAVAVHWGDLKVNGRLVLTTGNEIPTKTLLAPVSGRPYDETAREDRWMEAWIGEDLHLTHPSSNPQAQLPPNTHLKQNPLPGVHMDLWPYEELKRIAKRHGSYFAIDREGLLYPKGIIIPGHGVAQDDVFRSQSVGDHRGLIFIDTLDQTAPRADNMGTVTIRAPYLEAAVVVQGHVVLAPTAAGQSLSVLSPPQQSQDGAMIRVPVQLSGIQMNGLVYAAGNITVSGKVRLFGAVTTEGTITSGGTGSSLEVWYNHDYGQGLYKGLPVVYPAPGTWMARY
ncbi:hypothetical protein [Nitrospira moscoviensis]|uniref:Type 4 fimbrial biogenesis protein PilX N-terminal domain-containing protein n=1 Tax=Nitrospira moscoviensis TaxID=42253 RepID=A0A0K2GIR0_NITMO|nr:hypothetical protein [Nitrospira moscoviensis]ALA60826.1 conserved exported protein of unknown function [Nitrospira moscoviensis]